MIEKYSLDSDPYFNTYDPGHRDAAWKAAIKKFLNWEETQAQRDAIVKNQIIENYRKSVEVSETDGGAISVSLTHTDPIKASQYANSFMKEIRKLVEKENKEAQDLRLSYLSETLADALQEMETAQQNLKDYALQNSAQSFTSCRRSNTPWAKGHMNLSEPAERESRRAPTGKFARRFWNQSVFGGEASKGSVPLVAHFRRVVLASLGGWAILGSR